jgi:hypothetical protein
MFQQTGPARDGFFKFSALFRVSGPGLFVRPPLVVAFRDGCSLDDSATYGHN